jgi:hypothetical protein
VVTNWIHDRNACSIEKPPTWWLLALYEFDADLVVMPSREMPFHYRLARRIRRSVGIPLSMITNPDGDLAMMAIHKVVPVTTMMHVGATWSIDQLLANLRARDIWRHGGGQKVADTLDANDLAAEAKVEAEQADTLDHKSRDAWRSYSSRTGQRVLNAGTPQSAATPSHGARDRSPSSTLVSLAGG